MHQETCYDTLEDLRLMMADHLNVHASSFGEAVRKAGRLLPAPARAAAQSLVAIEGRMSHPKLAPRTDPMAAEKSARILRNALLRFEPGQRADQQRSLLLAEIGFRLLVVLCIVLVALQFI